MRKRRRSLPSSPSYSSSSSSYSSTGPTGSTSSTGSGANNNKKLECSSRVYKQNSVVEDIISNLPDHILHHIFTFLDIKQAIQTTCLLSRRWRYFWVSIPILIFTYNKGSRKTIRNEFMDFVDRRKTIRNEFMDFVDRVLMFRSSNSNIHEFTLVTNTDIDVTDRLNTWILVCIIHNVQQLTLHTLFPDKFQFHHCLFTCKSLTKLELVTRGNCVCLGLPVSITLPSLKTLSLRSVMFTDEYSTNQLFSCCPILESLTIICCEFPHINVNISSPKLRHLIIEYCTTPSNVLEWGSELKTNFQLCAPNLISFYWCNHISKHFAPKNLSSLVSASITVYGDSMLSKKEKTMYAPFMVNIPRGLHNVEDLTLSASILEVVTGVPYLLDSQPTQFCNLRCLKLEGDWRSVDCIHAISYLLKISPNIETLFIDVYYSNDKMHPYWNPDEVNSNIAQRGDCWKAGLSLEGLLNHLKCFELRKVTGRINELEFIEILLKNAIQLEELRIFFKIYYPSDEEKELTERRLDKFREKMLTFPKASSNVVIMFKYGKTNRKSQN